MSLETILYLGHLGNRKLKIDSVLNLQLVELAAEIELLQATHCFQVVHHLTIEVKNLARHPVPQIVDYVVPRTGDLHEMAQECSKCELAAESPAGRTHDARDRPIDRLSMLL